jgi:hypothetical protein
MTKFKVYSQLNNQTRKMEHSATVTSYDLVKLLQGYFEKQYLNFKYEKVDDVQNVNRK